MKIQMLRFTNMNINILDISKKSKSFITIELILTLAISSIIIISTLIFQTNIYKEDKSNRQIEVLKIDLLASKIFLEKNILNISKLKLLDSTLFFENSILLENISDYAFEESSGFIKISFIIEEKIKQEWILKR